MRWVVPVLSGIWDGRRRRLPTVTPTIWRCFVNEMEFYQPPLVNLVEEVGYKIVLALRRRRVLVTKPPC